MEEVALPSAVVDMNWTESEYETKNDPNLTFFPILTQIGNTEHTKMESLVGVKFNILLAALEDGSGKSLRLHNYRCLKVLNTDVFFLNEG